MKRIFSGLFLLALTALLLAQTAKPDLSITPQDVRIDAHPGGGYLLVIRAKTEIKSVILTESTADPNKKLDSYTLRSKEPNPVNASEKRRLNGKFIESKGMHFLMSSTPAADAEFGQAYRIFIPDVVVFGYPNARYGEISMLDGAYLNIRSFAQPYADYAGAYRDNPYTIRLTQKSRPDSGVTYNADAVKVYERLARNHQGKLSYTKGGVDAIPALKLLLDAVPVGRIDLVLCLDASKSMDDDAPYLRDQLAPLLGEFLAGHAGSRVGVIQFRDYMEDFLYRITPLGTDLGVVQEQMSEYFPSGGRDTPEAIYEGLNACVTEIDWQADRRLVILVGDAPPHPVPRGSVSAEQVDAGLKERNVSLQALILPD